MEPLEVMVFKVRLVLMVMMALVVLMVMMVVKERKVQQD